MGARFTCAGKWRDKWFRRLSTAEKVLFLYLCDTCDIAGFVEIDTDLMAFETGLSGDDVEGALKGLARGFVQIGEVLWLRNFLKHQRNLPLNPANKCHKGILSCIEHRPAFAECVWKHIAPTEGLGRGSQPPARGYGKGIGNGNGTEEGGVGGTDPPAVDLEILQAEPEWELDQYVNQFHNLRPEYARISTTAIANVLKTTGDRAVRAAAFNDFCRDVVCSVNGTDDPGRMLTGYIRNAGKRAERDSLKADNFVMRDEC